MLACRHSAVSLFAAYSCPLSYLLSGACSSAYASAPAVPPPRSMCTATALSPGGPLPSESQAAEKPSTLLPPPWARLQQHPPFADTRHVPPPNNPRSLKARTGVPVTLATTLARIASSTEPRHVLAAMSAHELLPSYALAAALRQAGSIAEQPQPPGSRDAAKARAAQQSELFARLHADLDLLLHTASGEDLCTVVAGTGPRAQHDPAAQDLFTSALGMLVDHDGSMLHYAGLHGCARAAAGLQAAGYTAREHWVVLGQAAVRCCQHRRQTGNSLDSTDEQQQLARQVAQGLRWAQQAAGEQRDGSGVSAMETVLKQLDK